MSTLQAKHGIEPKGIILVIFMQRRLRHLAVPQADTVLSGRRQPRWFEFGIRVAGGSSKVSGGRREEEERLVLGPRKYSNAREGLRSGSM